MLISMSTMNNIEGDKLCTSNRHPPGFCLQQLSNAALRAQQSSSPAPTAAVWIGAWSVTPPPSVPTALTSSRVTTVSRRRDLPPHVCTSTGNNDMGSRVLCVLCCQWTKTSIACCRFRWMSTKVFKSFLFCFFLVLVEVKFSKRQMVIGETEMSLIFCCVAQLLWRVNRYRDSEFRRHPQYVDVLSLRLLQCAAQSLLTRGPAGTPSPSGTTARTSRNAHLSTTAAAKATRTDSTLRSSAQRCAAAWQVSRRPADARRVCHSGFLSLFLLLSFIWCH